MSLLPTTSFRIILGLFIAIIVSFFALSAFPALSSTSSRTTQISRWLTPLSPFISFLSFLLSSPSLSTNLDFLSPSPESDSLWNLTTRPPYTTDNLIFNTASSLLQHWPNARYRNGHSIVPGRIPLGTVFYHGRSSPEMIESSMAGRKIKILPGTQEWVATDPEHSLLFCGIQGGADASSTMNDTASKSNDPLRDSDGSKSDCWFITLVTTRELRVLYFDGSSAAKMFGGSMDSQDVFAYRKELESGNVSSDSWDDPERIFGEVERLRRLCQWVEEKGLGIDGFVRMEMDFEVMLCDMSSGMEVVSFSNLAHSANPKSISMSMPEEIEAATSDSNPRVTIRNFELVHSASQHNAFPGEMKVRLDLDGFVSFYDRSLVKTSFEDDGVHEEGKTLRTSADRWKHRVKDVSKEDMMRVIERMEEVLLNMRKGRRHGGSGIDWDLLMQVLIKRYASRLEVLRYVLEASGNEPGARRRTDDERLQTMFDQLDVALRPFILADVNPKVPNPSSSPSYSSSSSSLDWASPIYRLCSATHTFHLHSPQVTGKMSKSEKTLLRAVEGTNREICRVLVGIWAQGIENGLGLEKMYHIPKAGKHQMKLLKMRWRRDLSNLMSWLDWSAWEKCASPCGSEEICYMPTWPYFAGNGGPPPGPARGPNGLITAEDESLNNIEESDWERPKPMCIRKIAPYKF
ncbi:hypothetical protein K435DRAFT_796522 [Dendrothele bispora CBS 962.96]|uniref:Uncharacterized protein n=1 Tax=Dendrothele bispora (strain CBS 962.96) TaxID=1314807 RepID=A0A4V4HG46_DENBC|nr:hypothetical protein K435DRAFT_796522 [Dendrothele bispora CBS 962.96]